MAARGGPGNATRGADGSPNAEELAIASRLFEGDPIAAIARDTRLSESSIRAYQHGQRRPAIRKHIEELERSTFASLRSRTIRARRKALDALIALLESEDPSIRLQAARTLLKQYVTGMDGGEDSRPRLTIVEVVQLIQQVRTEGVIDVTPAARLPGGNGDEDGHG